MSGQTDLTELVQRRDKLKEDAQRVRGRLDLARAEKTRVEEELRKKKVDPDKVDAVVEQLQQRLDTEVQTLKTKIADSEAKLAPYLEVVE